MRNCPECGAARIGYHKILVHSHDSQTITNYLPSNYSVTGEIDKGLIVEGIDSHGWTATDYVLPRLASGLIRAEIIADDTIEK